MTGLTPHPESKVPRAKMTAAVVHLAFPLMMSVIPERVSVTRALGSIGNGVALTSERAAATRAKVDFMTKDG